MVADGLRQTRKKRIGDIFHHSAFLHIRREEDMDPLYAVKPRFCNILFNELIFGTDIALIMADTISNQKTCEV